MKARDRLPIPYEREVLAAVIEALDMLGCRPRRRNIRNDPLSGRDGQPLLDGKGRLRYARSEASGEADVSATVPGLGIRLEVEVKRPREKPRADQQQRMEEVNAAGGIGVWVSDAEWIVRALPHLARGAKAVVEPGREPELFYPDSGAAGRVAWVLGLTEEEYQRCRATANATPRSS